jgi:hypothetical protein
MNLSKSGHLRKFERKNTYAKLSKVQYIESSTRLKTRNHIQRNAQKIHEQNECDINKEKILTYVHTVENISNRQ